jgi:iron complex transport system substrate-binding protein
MKKLTLYIILCTFVVLPLAGCAKQSIQGTATPEPAIIRVEDGLKRTVTLNQPAKRIVSLAPSATEILFAVGAGDQIVGRDSFSNYPEKAKFIQDVGGSMGNYAYEMITSLKPDLIIAAEINTPEQVKSLEDLGLNVYYISNPATLNDLYPILETVGKLTGHSDETAALINSLKARVEGVVKTMLKAVDKPSVFYEIDGSEPAKPWTFGPGTFFDQLVQMAGGTNAGSSLQSQWAQISIEVLLVKNPDVIVLGDSLYGITAEKVAARTGWDSIKAVKEGKIFPFNDDLISRPGPRLVDGLEALARILHPELFK